MSAEKGIGDEPTCPVQVATVAYLDSLFQVMDLQKGIRKTLLEKMREKFAHLDLTYSIGGQISFDVFPKGWDKTYCLRCVHTRGLSVRLGHNNLSLSSDLDIGVQHFDL